MAIYRFSAAQIGKARLRDWRRRVFGLALFLALVVLAAATGLSMLDDPDVPSAQRWLNALWNALNMITTTGDFRQLDSRQRVLMMLVMVIVVVLGASAIGQLTGILSSPEVVTYKENRRMQRELDRLSQHAVVIGYVGLGRAIAERLLQAGQQVVVIDREEDNAAEASGRGFAVVMGDAGIDDGVLLAARIDVARVLYVSSADPHRNLTLTLMSHTLNAGLSIVVTADNERWGEMLRRAGASRVVIADDVLASAMLDPGDTRAAAL